MKHETFNDGILEYGEIESIYAENRRKTGEEFSPTGKLFFKEMSCRDGDMLQANALGYVIDRKLKTPYRNDIDSRSKVKISEENYDIVKIDSDGERKSLFLYLQKVGV